MRTSSENWKPPKELVVYESKYWEVNHMPGCVYPGYLVIAPQNHHATCLLDISDAEMMEFGLVAKTVYRILKEAFQPERIYFCRFGNTPNCSFHFHAIPVHGWAIEAFAKSHPDDHPYGPEMTAFISNELIANPGIYHDSEPIEQTITELRNLFQKTESTTNIA
jgi:diadenosine tetraphosphate (Ap4A) HIT family hydrolase